MTDVTGFGLLGHLTEMCEGSGVRAEIRFDDVPKLPNLAYYLEQKSVPGGTGRNFSSYGSNIAPLSDDQRNILCDPQTSGGLLIAVSPDALDEVRMILAEAGLSEFAMPIGRLVPADKTLPLITVE
jgi:selenide,water dikinase